MSATEPVDTIWKLMSDVGMAMLVTHAQSNDMRARPMFARVETDENAIYFFTDANAPKDQEIAHDSHVCLAFADPKGSRYVSVSGTAEVIANTELAERLWRTADMAYFTNSNDPKLRIIRVTPEKGEYWEGSGMLSTLASLVKAGAKGERPKLGANAKVAM